jgi:DNA-binding LacI/PurR family transcriptional regulator
MACGVKSRSRTVSTRIREVLLISSTRISSIGAITFDAGYTGFGHLSGSPGRNDFAAIGALRATHKLGLRVPQDIAIAGFDNIPLAAFTTPSLTTVEQPIAQKGSAAAQFLLDRVEKRYTATARRLSMPCSLIIRESTSAG